AAYPQFAAYLVIELERPAVGHVQVHGGQAASAGEHRGGRQADLGEITREQPLGPAQWLTWRSPWWLRPGRSALRKVPRPRSRLSASIWITSRDCWPGTTTAAAG